VIEDKTGKDGWPRRQCHKSKLICLDEAEAATEHCEMEY
jgi:flavin reductase (DIM6/NTAB) family NADH-FMN oxidoreductase RutF